MKKVLIAASIGIVLGGGTGLGHEGHAHKVMGVLTAVATDRVGVKTRGGEMLSIALTPETTVRQDKRKVKVDELHIGRRVVVNIGAGEDPLVAAEIQVGIMEPAVTSRP